MEYNAAVSLNIRIMCNIKFSILFFHSCKTFSLLIYVIPCQTHAEVDFEVISVHVTNKHPVGYTITIQKVLEIMSFLVVLYSAYSSLCKLHLKSEIFPWRGGGGGGGGILWT